MNHYLKMILIFDDIAVKNGISATLEKKTLSVTAAPERCL